MKISHEAPKSIFKRVSEVTDYSYALVHLFEEDEEYLQAFKDEKWLGREIILDNSVFELETEFDSDRFYYWVEELQPTWFIIPDKLEDAERTIQNVLNWNENYSITTCSRSIGVVQGKTYEEVVKCYKAIQHHVDKIAISFDYSFFKTLEVTQNEFLFPTVYHQYMVGRQNLIERLLKDGVIDQNKPHHLLGCGLPQEFIAYRDYKWIDSVDTSNPVVHGINLIEYSEEGLQDKIKTKLIDYIDYELTSEQIDSIMHNIKLFRGFCNG